MTLRINKISGYPLKPGNRSICSLSYAEANKVRSFGAVQSAAILPRLKWVANFFKGGSLIPVRFKQRDVNSYKRRQTAAELVFQVNQLNLLKHQRTVFFCELAKNFITAKLTDQQ